MKRSIEKSDLLDVMFETVSEASGPERNEATPNNTNYSENGENRETAADIRANIERLRRELQILRQAQCQKAEQTIASRSVARDVREPEVVKHTRYSIVRRNQPPSELSIVVKNVCYIYS